MSKLLPLVDGLVSLISVITWPIVALFGSLQNILAENRYIGATLAIIIFTLSTSGIIYNLQHDMRWSGFDRAENKTIRINSQSRSQFLGEGLWFAFLNTLVGLLASLSLYIPTWLEKQRIARSLNNPYLSRVISGVFLVICFFAWRSLMEALVFKTRYLLPTFFPDESFVKGSIRRDRTYGA